MFRAFFDPSVVSFIDFYFETLVGLDLSTAEVGKIWTWGVAEAVASAQAAVY